MPTTTCLLGQPATSKPSPNVIRLMLAVSVVLAISIARGTSWRELPKARLHFNGVFKPNPKYKEEDVVSDLGEVYKVGEFFPAGRADCRLIFGQSSETGNWILARHSMRGKKSTTDWLVHLQSISTKRPPVAGTFNIWMRRHSVALPANAPAEVKAEASRVTGYAFYRWDGWLGGAFTSFLQPNGHEAQIDASETAPPGRQYIVTKAERRFLAGHRRKHR